MMEKSGSPEQPQEKPYINPADLPRTQEQNTSGAADMASGEITVPGSGDSDAEREYHNDWTGRNPYIPPESQSMFPGTGNGRQLRLNKLDPETYAYEKAHENNPPSVESKPVDQSAFERFRDALERSNILNSAVSGEQTDHIEPLTSAQSAREEDDRLFLPQTPQPRENPQPGETE